jgi:hypothetical protein
MEKKSLQTYALIDASASEEVLSQLQSVISVYGKRIRKGVVLTPHGESPVIFFEIKKKEGPIVEVLSNLAERYSLYPLYVIQENKDHLPKHANNIWYMVDEVKYELTGVDDLEAWKKQYSSLLKEAYREDHVFIKSFIYQGKSGLVHVMSFNSERQPNYRGTMLGVAEWHEQMDKLLKAVNAENVISRAVRYTNL